MSVSAPHIIKVKVFLWFSCCFSHIFHLSFPRHIHEEPSGGSASIRASPESENRNRLNPLLSHSFLSFPLWLSHCLPSLVHSLARCSKFGSLNVKCNNSCRVLNTGVVYESRLQSFLHSGNKTFSQMREAGQVGENWVSGFKQVLFPTRKL